MGRQSSPGFGSPGGGVTLVFGKLGGRYRTRGNNMTNKITMAVILSILILGTFVQRTMAPEEQPEKLNLSGTGYNDETGNFEIQLSSDVETTASLTKDGHPVANSETSRTDTGIVIGGRTDP